jgi:hypothetical protein
MNRSRFYDEIFEGLGTQTFTTIVPELLYFVQSPLAGVSIIRVLQ